MSKNRIVHCMYAEKFIDPFITFVEKHFDADQHLYLIKRFLKYEVTPRNNTKFISATITFAAEVLFYIYHLNYSKKIIIHGLFNPRLVVALFVQPWLLKKCYWVMWGGDLYFYKLRSRNLLSNVYEKVRAQVIKRIGNFITQIEGDYALAQKWYGANGKLFESFMYPSNLYHPYPEHIEKSTVLNILLGNSGNPSNKHYEIFYKLEKFKNENIRIYCPLSYGDSEYASLVSKAGLQLFGNKFIALNDFMPHQEYIKLLSSIDIAIFAHDRQQASGNTVTLLGLGKKVFMNNGVTTWNSYAKLGLNIYDVDQLNLEMIDPVLSNRNKKIISEYFSEKNLINQQTLIFK